MNSAILKFPDYNMTKCKKPGSYESSKTTDYLKDAAYDDVAFNDCVERHNGLVDRIRKRLQSLTE